MDNDTNKKTRLRPLAVLVIALVSVASGCVAKGEPVKPTPPLTTPADFALRYEWQAGSMPPPYHYEYSIRLGPGPAGEITFWPDYPWDGTPVWTESFTLAEESLPDLHALIAGAGVFTRQWRERDDAAVGGSLERMQVTADGRTVSIPSQLAPDDAAAIEAVYAAVRGMVPKDIWDRLMARRDEYERNYSPPE